MDVILLSLAIGIMLGGMGLAVWTLMDLRRL